MADDQEKRRARQAKAYADATNAKAAEANYYVRDPKTGLSPAQVEANKAVTEAAAISGRTVTSGATGASATSDRVTLTGADRAAKTKKEREDRFAAELAAREASKPTEDPGEGNIWSYSVAEGRWKRVKVGEPLSDTQRLLNSLTGDGSKENPYRYKDSGKLFTGSIGFGDYVNGVLKSSGNGNNKDDGDKTTTTYTAPDGRIFTDINAYNAYIQETKNAEQKAQRQSAYDLLFEQFNQYGLGGLVTPLRSLIESGVNPAEFTIKLRETDAYKKRFAANSARINKGLRALSEAEYINLEDQYQDVMRRYGLPQEYYARGDMGRQEGFEKFIGGDVSPVELEDRVQTAQRRVLNAAPQVKAALTQFYGAEIGNGDILAYVLDPDKAIENIKRKVTAAEIGGGAMRAGLGLARARAEELGQYGVTGEQAVTGFGTIASGLERGRQLSQIYNQPDYTQAVAEAEVFALPDAEKARRQRRKLGQLETATFGGTSGVTGGALDRERAGQY
jgi:hypothetical protein